MKKKILNGLYCIILCYLLFVIQYYNTNARMVVIENLNVLMAALILSYASSIGIIWKIYKNQKENSISEILNKNKWRVMGSAIMMGMITCLCEHQRIQHVPPEDVHWHQYGFACIVALSFSFLCVIVIKSTSMVHRMFAIVAFTAIVGYTFVHLALNQTPICAATLATQFASCANITHWYVLYDDIFLGEVVFLLSFFSFYLYNHWNYIHNHTLANAKS